MYRPTLLRTWPALAIIILSSSGAPASDDPSHESARAALLLLRATYGPQPGELDRILAIGSDAWLDRQLHPERIDDDELTRKLARFSDLAASTEELLAKYPEPTRDQRQALAKLRAAREAGGDTAELDDEQRAALRGMRGKRARDVVEQLVEAKLMRAVESNRQLEEVLVDFWFNHFNVFARKNQTTVLTLPSFERDAIRPHVLGNFEEMLVAVAQHPAMLLYLDNWTNAKDGFDPRAEMMNKRRSERGWNRRSARADTPSGDTQRRKLGINENYARELLELHTLGVDGGYTQADVEEVARCFTGWTVRSTERMMRERRASRNRPQQGGMRRGMDGDFHFSPMMHDDGPKTVLGRRISAGGVDDGLVVLHLLAEHPSTARFIASKLAKRFVSDTPSPALIDAMATTFTSTHGDLRAVLATMFASPLFVEEGLAARKVKTPLELVVSSMRAIGARMIHGQGLVRTLQTLGMPLYLCQPPTGYDEEADTWLTAGSVLNRIRFVGGLVSDAIPGVWIPAPPRDVDAWMAQILPDSPRLSADAQATLGEALAEVDGLDGAKEARQMALVLASPAFNRQ